MDFKARMAPRSIVAWFAVCWIVFLIAALVVGAMMVALYRETTTQRVDRASAIVARACDSIARDVRLASEPRNYIAIASQVLERFAGVEGGVWKSGVGSLGYAFPTYEGSGPKTDLPQAELPAIEHTALSAIAAHRLVDWRRPAQYQSLMVTACPVAGIADVAAWAMTRITITGGRPFLLAVSGLAMLLIVLLGSAVLLGRVLWRWSGRLSAIEGALARGSGDLPVLDLTGQRDLDRIILAINGAGTKASEARARTAILLQRVADGERLASLGRVSAGVAHEIRNPISAMRLKAENALAHADDRNRSMDALRVVIEQVGRMDDLLQNLLRSVQRSDIVCAPMDDLAAFLSTHASLFREQAGNRRLIVSVDANASGCAFDQRQIGGALDNLILNAIQNSDDDTTIEISAIVLDGALQIHVADTGYGVAVDVRDHLFEPFATGRAGGTGLGLAISREVAEAHGGSIRAEHRVDGTTFTIQIPVVAPRSPRS